MTTSRTARNTAAHQRAGFTPEQAVSLEAIMADAERRIADLIDAGDLDAAARFASDTEAFLLATFA
jgi:hypothetical protein